MQKITVTSHPQPYTVTITNSRHSWTGDEPTDLGGADAGPTAFELLLGSVGACVAITVQMYARRKGWPLDSVVLDLEHSKIEAADCEDCETEKGKISEIRLRLYLQGALSEEQRDRIFQIAGRCPVKRTLEGEIKFRSELV
jgi:putative redox protein